MPRMEAPDSGVKVRMYRQQGLGDCFLLAFSTAAGEARYLLIDCGVFFATSGGSARMKKIAQDIAEATDKHLHVLVGTHEHYDHLSGFGFKGSQNVFKDEEFQVDQVWVAWTEDETNPLAQKLRNEIELALRGLRATATRLAASDPQRSDRIAEILHFFGPGRADPQLAAASTAKQFEFIKTQWGDPHYRRPGEAPLALPGVEGVRIYVLGPPEDEGLLKKSDPTPSASEVYEEGVAPLTPGTAFHAAVAARSLGDRPGAAEDDIDAMLREVGELTMPFGESHRLRLDDLERASGKAAPAAADPMAANLAFFDDHYGFGDGDEQAWRRIDDEWLRAAEHLALQLDNHVNNTSLALAIELIDSGRVLLFPGDAQVGNWLSWRDVEWQVDGEAVSGEDLIRRTVFYKVGHHASHNATLREHGLELMSSDGLVAMIPVDEEQAKRKDWKMPFEPLFDRLKEKTRGRIIRADKGLSTRKPSALSAAEWEEFKARRASDPGADNLWHEYHVTG